MSVYPITTSLKIIKPPQWVKETIKGTTPTSPAFNMLPAEEFSPIVQAENIKYRKLGNTDISKNIALPVNYSFSLNYAPVDTNLLEAMIALIEEGVTYNRKDSFTFLMSQQHNNAGTLAEMYQIARGCSIESITITVDDGQPIKIESQWSALTISDWSTSHGLSGTPVFASEISDSLWSAITTGANPLTFNSQSYDIRHFSVTINHNPERLYILDPLSSETVTKRIEVNARDITIEMDVVFKDESLSDDTKSFSPRTMSLRLHQEPNVILTFTDLFLEEYDETVAADSTEAKVISYTGFANSILLETVPLVAQTSIQKYNITGNTIGASIQKYDLSQYVIATSIQTYDILTTITVNQDSIQKYDMGGVIVANSIQKYDLEPLTEGNFVSDNFIADNFVLDLLTTISNNSIQKYNLLENIVNTSVHKYDILSNVNVAQTSKHKYNLLNNIAQTSIEKYNLLNNIAQTSLHKYNIEAGVPAGPTRLYLHAATDSTSGLPTAEQSTLTVTSGCNFEGSQTTNRSMNTTIGTAQTSTSFTGAMSTSPRNYYVTRFVSPALNQTSLSTNTWTYAFTASAGLAANFPVSGTNQPVYVNCYVWRPSNSTKVGTILDGNSAATVDEATSSNVQTWHIVNFTGSAVASMQAGDVIIFEAWFVIDSSSTTSQTLGFYYDGVDDTYAENATSTSAASFIETPEGLIFQ